MKKQLVLGMLVLLVLCWYVATESYLGAEGKYEDAIKKAEALEEKEIYIKAIDSYKEALTHKADDFQAMYNIAQDYKLLEEEDEYEKQMHSMLTTFGPDETILKELYQYYMDMEHIDEAADLVYGLKEQYPENELVDSLYEERKGDYLELFQTYEDISSFNGSYAIFTSGEMKGLADGEGEAVISAKYTEMAFPSGANSYIAVADGEKAFWINMDGYKVEQTDETYEYISGVASGCMLAKKNGKYGYLGEDYKERTSFEWEDATMIYYQLGAVKKDGKWALINEKMELITDYIYDDVIYNEWRIASMYGVLWAGQNGQYQLINKEGTVLTANTYDDAKVFAGEEPCAVKKDDVWGFVAMNGEEVIAPTYEDACSFNKGFAPVKKQSQWGLIDLKNKIVLDYTFDEMKSLNDIGVAPVKSGDVWSLIKLKIYK